MRCVTHVTAPACFGAISSFTKAGAVLRKQETRFVVFLVHIRDITLATRILSEPEWPFPLTTVQSLAAFDPHGDQNSFA